jgi:uncharacterized protein YkwD
MRTTRLTNLILTGAAALTIAGFAPSAASASSCANADMRPTPSNYPDPLIRGWLDARMRIRAATAVICLTNEQRMLHGLQPVSEHSALAAAAHKHAQDMTTRKYFSHYSPATPCDRARQAGYPATYCTIGENIKWGPGATSTPRATVNWWMGSPPHRATLLYPHQKHIGVGVSPYAPAIYTGQAATYVQMFGIPS